LGAADTEVDQVTQMAQYFPSESKQTRFFTDFDADKVLKDMKELLELTAGIT
jgi:hypothetical protein